MVTVYVQQETWVHPFKPFDPGVEGGVVQLGVTEQRIDHPDVDVVLEKVGGEAVAQRVWISPLNVTAACAASATMRWSWRVLIGFSTCCPGNSQPSRCITPC